MKRSFVVAVLILTALFSASALASGSSSVKGGFLLGFDAKYSHGKPKKVKNFHYSSLPLKCSQGNPSASGGPLPSMRVKRRKFHGTFRDHGTKTEVHGRYNKALSKVKGTLQVSGKYAGFKGCDSGKVKWVTN